MPIWIFSLCALVCAAAALGVSIRSQGEKRQRLIALGLGLTALWGLAASAAQVGLAPALPALLLDPARLICWLAVLAVIIDDARGTSGTLRGILVSGIALGLASLGGFVLTGFAGATGIQIAALGHLGLALAGLILVESVVRRAARGGLWSVKFLCLGIGGLFAFDFYTYANVLLFRELSLDLVAARSVIAVLIAPLLAIAALRRPALLPDLRVSRGFALGSAALTGAGVYLVLMGAAGYYIREFGGAWSGILQVGFLFAALLLLAAVLSSGSLRARLRVVLAKHFFAYRYDYRSEWLKFIAAMSQGGGDLTQRAIRAVASLVDSPGGAIWLREDHTATFSVAGSWNCGPDFVAPFDEDELPGQISAREWVLDFKRQPEDAPTALMRVPRAWLAVPLIHRGHLLGLLVMQESKAPRDLNWEDYDLLRAVGRQAAGYLSEQQATMALADSRQFDLFNRRFAFVVHDIKTVINQMSLLLRNAQKHADNPQFQRDLLDSVEDSVESMRQILAQIGAERSRLGTEQVDLAALLRETAQSVEAQLHLDVTSLPIRAEKRRLKSVLSHLLDNAREAAGASGHVEIRLQAETSLAVIAISDSGAGMDPAFVRDLLFRPFRSTKSEGFGIGGFQAREAIKDMGGRLIVDSHPGQGTTMRIELPLELSRMTTSQERITEP